MPTLRVQALTFPADTTPLPPRITPLHHKDMNQSLFTPGLQEADGAPSASAKFRVLCLSAVKGALNRPKDPWRNWSGVRV